MHVAGEGEAVGQVCFGLFVFDVSADWIRLAMTDSTFKVGPRRGFRVTYRNAKYLGRKVFTQLISRGFVGTASTRSKAFRKAMEKLGSDRELIIAIRAEWQDDTEPESAALLPDTSSTKLPF